MNELKVFENPEFGKIRTIEENGKVLFCSSDAAKALGYVRPNDAVSAHCRYTVKRRIPHPQNPEKQIEMVFIPEGDVYRLMARSELPGADKFESWIFDDVVPSIRKHGMYATENTVETLLNDPDTAIRILQEIKEERNKRKALEEKAEADRPKVLFADSVAASKNSILVGEMAKLLKQNGVETGQNRLFETLREKGFLIKRQGTDYNMPTQKAMEMGLFEIKETVVNHADGHTSVNKTPKVTGKGQTYFVNMFLGGIRPE